MFGIRLRLLFSQLNVCNGVVDEEGEDEEKEERTFSFDIERNLMRTLSFSFLSL